MKSFKNYLPPPSSSSFLTLAYIIKVDLAIHRDGGGDFEVYITDIERRPRTEKDVENFQHKDAFGKFGGNVFATCSHIVSFRQCTDKKIIRRL